MGAANTKKKLKTYTPTLGSNSTSAQQSKLKETFDKNHTFHNISNVDTITFTLFALQKWALSDGFIIPKEILPLILLDMRRPHSPLRSTFRIGQDANEEVKIIVLGPAQAGKSAYIIQFVTNQFVAHYDPTIEDSYRKLFKVDEGNVLFDILDTAGQEEFSAMRDSYMRTGEGFILVFSLTDRKGFEELATFRDQILRVKDADEFPMVVVGNKSDLPRQVTIAEGTAFARLCGPSVPYFETSSLNCTNIDESFYDMAREIHKNKSAITRPIRHCGRRMCGILAEPLPIINDNGNQMLNDFRIKETDIPDEGCCHTIVEERFEVVWRQAIQQLLKDDDSLSLKDQIKKEICLKLSIEAMKEVTEEYEIDIRIAEEILMKRNERMGLHF